jgi:hypothetical protein
MTKEEAFYQAIRYGVDITHTSFKDDDMVRIDAKIIISGNAADDFIKLKDYPEYNDGWSIIVKNT